MKYLTWWLFGVATYFALHWVLNYPGNITEDLKNWYRKYIK